MKKTDVMNFFKNRAVDVASACGVTSAAVAQWDEIIPERNALKLDRVTEGKLRYDPSLYQKRCAA